jgi:hypothetical protein
MVMYRIVIFINVIFRPISSTFVHNIVLDIYLFFDCMYLLRHQYKIIVLK